MGHTIRVAEDSISGVRAMSTAPIHATRSRLRFARPPLSSSSPGFEAAASPLALYFKAQAQRPFLPAKGNRIP